MADIAPDERIYATIRQWCAMSGMSRSQTYERLGRGELSAIRVGGRTLVDVRAGVAWLQSRPAVNVKAPPPPWWRR